MHVLIADDDSIALELLRDALCDAGHEVTCAIDGRDAEQRLVQQEFQVLITDWEMPGVDGLGLCRAVRHGELQGRAYIYVILLTAHNSVAEKIRGLSAGADDFISKPFDPQELIVRMQAAERLLSLETRDVAIFAMAKLAESRDPETGAHLERVMNYSRILAQQLPLMDRFTEEIDAEFVRLIHSTSPLHDIGKVGMPDGVLLKPGRLSDREFDIMKTHTTIGAQTLDAALQKFPNAKYLRMARDIAASHHERYDGAGYPCRLNQDQIPLCARIVALADVYDALTSKRVYKNAFAHEVAMGIIAKDSGTHFDPAIVEAFLAIEPTFVSIREKFQEQQSLAA